MSKLTEKSIEIEGRKIILKYPSVGESTDADTEYSKAFTMALKDGLMPKAIMEKTLVDNGLWTEEDTKEEAGLAAKLTEIMAKNRETTKQDEKDKLKEEFYRIQEEIMAYGVKKQSLSAHCAENKGEEARIAYLAWRCILNEENNRLWETQEEFFSNDNNTFVRAVLQEFVSFTTGLDEKINNLDKILDGEFSEQELVPEEESSSKKEPVEKEDKKEEVAPTS